MNWLYWHALRHIFEIKSISDGIYKACGTRINSTKTKLMWITTILDAYPTIAGETLECVKKFFIDWKRDKLRWESTKEMMNRLRKAKDILVYFRTVLQSPFYSINIKLHLCTSIV